MARDPIVNERGTIHMHIKGLPAEEAVEFQRQLELQKATNTDHHYRDEPVWNPIVSKAQQRAMFAAAEGHSNLGIPAKVGKEFTKPYVGHPGSLKGIPGRKK